MCKKFFLVSAVFAGALCAGCFGSCESYPGSTGPGGERVLTIAGWNVQALFDGRDDGSEYEEYRAGSGWTEEKYAARLNAVASALGSTGGNAPDIIAFIEIENREITDRLNSDYLDGKGYKYSFFAGNPGYSLGIAVISKIPFERTTAHSINVEGEAIPRPVAEMLFDIDGKRLAVFACHWKSKLGGEAGTERLRREAARVIIRREKALYAENPDTAIVILGDFNENHDEFYRRGSEYVCALVPDDPEAARKTGFWIPDTDESPQVEGLAPLSPPPVQDFLIISNEKPPTASFFSVADGVYYSPWGNEIGPGSYYYDGGWETIDNMLLNAALFDGKNLEFRGCYVPDCEPFVNSKGEPDRYNPRTGSGLSDHLPVILSVGIN